MVQAENRSPLCTRVAGVESVSTPPIEFSFPGRYREAYLRELEIFRDCLIEKKPLPVTYEDARKNYILAVAAEESFKSGKPVSIDYESAS